MAYLDHYLKDRINANPKGKKIKQKGLLSAGRREHVLNSVMDQLKDWRFTPFESEGAVRHGLRSALCADGNRWARSDLEAETIINQAFRLMGVQRPTWEQGQPEYVEPRENCKWCSRLLPDDLQRGGSRNMYCSEHCARAAMVHRVEGAKSSTNKTAQAIYDATRRLRAEPKPCAACQKLFRPRSGTEKLCSVDCRAVARIVVLTKICVQCGIQFRPRSSRNMVQEEGRGKFCSVACKGKFQAAQAFEKTCFHCDALFISASKAAKYCSSSCTNRAFRLKRTTIAENVIAFPILRPITAEIFDGWFKQAA
ncbi:MULTISPECIES: hypothetical protein [Rhizobium/Agrobacterium group]|uniref:TRASH domain-containing protein n=2 Tax=Rhizobium/Agrobacterium group TaxID=227290 RepID=B9JSC6_ALLAM|nr:MULTISPECIES: hypothetical protein [Rhizobium/Agrobacterium group]ACM35619.1 hypothetical protein Avi_0876 [Allorhizobium ampelinum S4]MUO29442.1 hypothetical protein [Agrobacterium vitis]MUO42617.1 hypothetical protein [Agrobacterium vitis]MUP10586.1 hypothetical protein [Agrobacterium vitis]